MSTLPRAVPVEAPVTSCWDTDLVRVYHERYGSLVRLAYVLTGQSAVAEEIVQDAFVDAHRACDRVRDPFAYVRTAVVSRSRSWGRRHKLERERRPPPPDPDTLAADEMWDALATLPERQRMAIVLRFYADLPHDEIAGVLGCRTATVRTSVHRGLRSLRRVIDR
ncbi:MAG: sigma-70 family RNA polymerase sigma factor [Acidimicrobiia bacterium]